MINSAIPLSYRRKMTKRILTGSISIVKRTGLKLLSSPGFPPVYVSALMKNLKEHKELDLWEDLKAM